MLAGEKQRSALTAINAVPVLARSFAHDGKMKIPRSRGQADYATRC